MKFRYSRCDFLKYKIKFKSETKDGKCRAYLRTATKRTQFERRKHFFCFFEDPHAWYTHLWLYRFCVVPSIPHSYGVPIVESSEISSFVSVQFTFDIISRKALYVYGAQYSFIILHTSVAVFVKYYFFCCKFDSEFEKNLRFV